MANCWSNARERSIAVLATLHLGIEPALLALLVQARAMPPLAADWVVGAGQLGMSAGALLCWRSTAAAGRPAALAAAVVGTGAGLGLGVVHHLADILLLRLLLGGAMGLLFTRATAMAARAQAHHAIGFILLGQQLLATLVMIVLPIVAVHWSVATALLVLAAVPLAAGLLVRDEMPSPASSPCHLGTVVNRDAERLKWVNLSVMALLVAVTLMVWSYIDAIGARSGVDPEAAGIAIALASLASAPAALLASLAPPRYAPWLTALLCGVAILSPLLLPQASGIGPYAATMVLFNAGSTFGAIRFTAWTMEGFADPRGRRAVVLVQCAATAGGAPLGAIAVGLGGLTGLAVLVASCVAAVIVAPLSVQRRRAVALLGPALATS